MFVGKCCKRLAGVAVIILLGFFVIGYCAGPWGSAPSDIAILGVYRTHIYSILREQNDISLEDIISIGREMSDIDVIEEEPFSNPKAFGGIYLLDGSDGSKVVVLDVRRRKVTAFDRSGKYQEISWEEAKAIITERATRSVSLVLTKDR